MSKLPIEGDPASRQASHEDVRYAYHLFLGRDPETVSRWSEKVGVDVLTLMEELVNSSEFLLRVRDLILSLKRPKGDRFDFPPELNLRRWAACSVPLGEQARPRVEAAERWIDLYWAVFSDETFQTTTRAAAALRPPFLDNLDALRGHGDEALPEAAKPHDVDWLLVTGAPRSGTTLLRAMLAQHPNVALLQEYGLNALIDRIDAIVGRPAIQEIDWECKKQLNDARFEKVAAFYRNHPGRAVAKAGDGQFDKGAFHAMAAGVFQALAPEKPLRVVGDKMPMSEPWEDIQRLADRLPNFKILLIVRNPAEVVKSSLIRLAATRRGLDYWPIKSVQEAAAQWVHAWHLTRLISARYLGSVLVIKYEDLCADPSRLMADIDAFLDIPAHLPDVHVTVRPADLSMLKPAEDAVLARLLGRVIADWASSSPEELMASHTRLSQPCVFGRTIRFEREDAGSYLACGFSGARPQGR